MIYAVVGEKVNEYSFLVRTAEGQRPFGRCRRIWENNI
jgi:hypothetical protein